MEQCEKNSNGYSANSYRYLNKRERKNLSIPRSLSRISLLVTTRMMCYVKYTKSMSENFLKSDYFIAGADANCLPLIVPLQPISKMYDYGEEN